MAVMDQLASVDWFSFVGSIATYMFWVVIMAVLSIAGYFGMQYFSFNISADVYPLVGTGKAGYFSVGKKKKQRFKWIKNRTAWKPMKPFMNKKEVEPFPPEYIYPGNSVICYKQGDQYIPGEHQVNNEGKTITASMKPVPYYIRNWQSLAHKKIAQEYANKEWWDQNKSIVLALATCVFCLTAAVVTVWLSYKMAGPNVTAMNGLADSIRNFNVIPGK